MFRSLVAVVLSLLLAACSGGGGGAGPLAWRDLDLVVPAGWTVVEQRNNLLQIANKDFRADDVEATPALPQDPQSNDAVAVQFLGQSSSADAIRDLVESEGGEIESDQQIQLDGVPARSITYSWVTNKVPTREQIVLVPSRDLEITLQPVPVQGQQTGPEVYLEYVEEFQAVLDSIDFGAPEGADFNQFDN